MKHIFFDPTPHEILRIRTQMERNNRVRREIKASAMIVVVTAFIFVAGTRHLSEGIYLPAFRFWIVSILVLAGLFCVDVWYLKKNRDCEWEIYHLDVAEQEDNKELSRIRPDLVSDYQLQRIIDPPDEKITLPVLYYAVLLAADLLAGIVGFL